MGSSRIDRFDSNRVTHNPGWRRSPEQLNLEIARITPQAWGLGRKDAYLSVGNTHCNRTSIYTEKYIMKRTSVALGVASLLILSATVSAEEQLSMAQMDGVTAGGSAVATAIASAFGNVTATATATLATVQAVAFVPGQVGQIAIIGSNSNANASAQATGSPAQAGGTAIALGSAAGATVGSGLSDTQGNTEVLADSIFLFAGSASSNTSIASSVLIGLSSSANSAAASAAALSN